MAHAVQSLENMKSVLARGTSLLGILVLAGGVMAAACSAPPAGRVGSDDQDQTEDDGKLPATSKNPTEPSNTTNNNAAPSTPTPSTTTPAPTPSPEGGTTPAPVPGTGQCAAAADMFACFDCCDAAHPGGWEVADQAWGDCICQTACAQACGGNFCQGGQPSAACEQCLDTAQQCDAAADAACAANANCAAANACAQSSQCETKPDP
jgi:hypothetical protein